MACAGRAQFECLITCKIYKQNVGGSEQVTRATAVNGGESHELLEHAASPQRDVG